VQRLESIDAAHPETVALLAGPLVLMRVLDGSDSATSPVARATLLGAQRDRSGRHEWQVPTEAGYLTLKPFLDIEAESYSAYQETSPS
jgi:hypothetical protein